MSEGNEPQSGAQPEAGVTEGSPSGGQTAVPDGPASPTGKLSESAGAWYGALIDAQLAEERLTKTSLEQRGITVITTGGAIVGLLFGLVAVVTQATEFALPDGVRPWLTWSLMSFTASTLDGLLVNFPTTYEEAKPGSLREFIRTADDDWAPDWEQSDFVGSRQVAELNVRLLEVARAANSFKARFLFGALLLEVLGIALLAIVVLFITQMRGN